MAPRAPGDPPASPLLTRGFLALAGSYGLSTLGDAFRMVAVNVWLVETLGGSLGQRLGLVLLANVPGILCGGLAGVVADRSDRFAILLRTDVARIGVGLALAVAMGSGAPMPALLLVGLGNALGVLSSAASFAALSALVPTGAMLRANGLLESAQRVAQVAGPALAAVVLTAGGPVAAALVDSACFLASSLLLAGLRARMRAAPVSGPLPGGLGASLGASLGAGLASGLRMVRTDGRLPAFLAVSAAVAFLTACTSVALGPLATGVLGREPAAGQVLYGITGGAALAAAVLTTALGTERRAAPVLLVGVAALCLAQAALGATPGLPAAIVAAAVAAAASAPVTVAVSTLLKGTVRTDHLGRIAGIDRVVDDTAIVVGHVAALGGLAAADARLVLVGSAVAVLPLVVPALLRLRARPTARVGGR
ncbi:hypothetical protein C5B94_06630 [Clavibacter michiganensis]|uniref:MFS transporter n=1 Tax=Clavibacter michiganensis TaxID=28447 RepID=UPI000CE773DA|nr:MFS transporter [Clavibacter michiganensis]PPF54951.1 hypothetical protein C5B94_06630 [Clavibacter michiganensis]